MTPSPKSKLGRGDFCASLYKNYRLEVANLHVGGCQYTFRRVPFYILEADNCLGGASKIRGDPQERGGHMGSRDMTSLALESSLQGTLS